MVDILAFGIHPDDVELSCGGTIAKEISNGKVVAICDLTKGEMGTRGNSDTRFKESEAAKDILGVSDRVQLDLEDVWVQNNKASILKIIEIIRYFKPKIVLCNAISDRHPNHPLGYQMVKEAVFYSGLSKISTTYNNQLQEAFRPNAMYSYIQSDFIHPDFVVDITDFFDVKMKSILAYASQFYNPNNEEEQEETFISTPEFLKLIESKDRIFGKSIGVTFAEGFKVERYIGVNSLFDLF